MEQANRCEVGAETDAPCPRVATEFVNREDRPDWCWPHLFSTRIRDAQEDNDARLDALRAELERWIHSR